jgi:hypothetical protein
MNLHSTSSRHRHQGYALMLVVIFIGVSLVTLTGVLSGTANSALFTDRNNAYAFGVSAADAAMEKTVGTMTQDYMDQGESTVYANLGTYRASVPSAKTESDYWADYEFTDAAGKVNAVSVERTANWTYGELPDKYRNLKGNFATYKVTATARPTTGTRTNIVATVQQDLLLASIPIFAYQFFYALDLELCPVEDFDVYGRIHCNRSIYFQPDSPGVLTLRGDVSVACGLNHTNSPLDPVYRQFKSVVYQAERDTRSRVLKLPLGTNTTTDLLRTLIEIPPISESATSLVGQQRFYNKAEMIILIRDSGVTATSGYYNGFATTIPWSTVDKFVNTNLFFYDKREGREVRVVDFDIAKLNNQAANLKSLLNRDVKIVYIADISTTDSYAMKAIRVINAATLPTTGLTIATVNPLYTRGHFNTTGANTGTTNTTKAYPGALVADAVTTLSGNWSDTYSYYDFTSRRAANTTINAAIITGIVPSNGSSYSGGVENSLRLLEDWHSRTLTFNGAVSVLFDSRIATAPWGSTADVYNPPDRNWSWDQNFWTQSKLPPGTPEVRTILRSQYTATQVAK